MNFSAPHKSLVNNDLLNHRHLIKTRLLNAGCSDRSGARPESGEVKPRIQHGVTVMTDNGR